MQLIKRKFSVRGVELEFLMRDVRPERGLVTDVVKRQAYLKQFEKLFGSLPENGVCIDIGGNIGICSVIYEKVFGFKEVWAFEPIPWSAELFEENLKLNGCSKTVLKLAAVSDKDGEIQINYDHVSFASASAWSKKKRNVLARSIDARQIIETQPVSFLKLDCEGAEFPILECCSLSTVGAMVVEFHPAFCENFESRYRAIKEKLSFEFDFFEEDDRVNKNIFAKRK